MPPAARISDMHVCPLATPGTPPIPHVGGPISMGCPTVMIGFLPAARVGDMAICVGPPDSIAKGSLTVMIGSMPAARIGDLTVHGGNIVVGCPTVMIGDMGMGSPGAPSVPVLKPPHGVIGPLRPALAPPSSAGTLENGESGGGTSGSSGAPSLSPGGGSPSASQTPEEPREKTWIAILLKDFEGTPLPNQNFRIALEGGQVLSGRTDSQGKARFEGVEPDSGEVHFLEIPDEGDYGGSAAGESAGAASDEGYAVSRVQYEIPDDGLEEAAMQDDPDESAEEDEEG
jgi:uncharacterized Zn-binding protein involved in type VI secretion